MTKLILTLFFLVNASTICCLQLYDIYQLASYIPSIGPSNISIGDSEQIVYTIGTMPSSNNLSNVDNCSFILVIGASNITIGTWLKFDNRPASLTETDYTSLFNIEGSGGVIELYRNTHEHCYLQVDFGPTEGTEQYSSPCNYLRACWYFTAVTLAFSSSTFDLDIYVYNTTIDSDLSQMSKTSWTGPTNYGVQTFQANDSITLRCGCGHYPAVDVTFSGFFIMPHYVNLNVYHFNFGTYDCNFSFLFVAYIDANIANYLLIYKFSSTTSVTDESGNGYDGVLDYSLSAPQTFSITSMVTISSNICPYLQPQTQVVGFFFLISVTYTSSGTNSILFSVLSGSAIYCQFLISQSASTYTIGISYKEMDVVEFPHLSFTYGEQYALYLMVRTTTGGVNDIIDSVLYDKTNNSTGRVRINGITFIPTICTLNLGDLTSGFAGTLSEFRIFTGTGAIPGMPYLSSQNCPQSVGITNGTNDPCFDSCSDINCIECSAATICSACQHGLYLFNYGSAPPSCLTDCPFGYINNDTIQACSQCSDIGLLYFNGSCISVCPDAYVVDSTLGGCVKCTNGLIYYNKTCVASCPLTTFVGSSVYECQPCALGCDICTDSSKYDCKNCSAGYFYSNGSCGSGCPSNEYADPITRVCEQCQPPCTTCIQPNNLSCTSCPEQYYLLNGTCVTSCPTTYYLGFYGNSTSYRVPACIPKLILYFNLSLTSDARVVYINFNYGIADVILPICNRIQIQIANSQITSEFYSLSPISESSIKFEYLGDQYYPPLSLLNVTLDLDSDYNTDPYQEYHTVNKSAFLNLKEIYPFTAVEIETITVTANLTSTSGVTIAAGLAVGSIAEGAISLSFLRMQLIGESVQLLRFIDLRWPPSVNQMFSISRIDPTSIVLPFDLTRPWNDNLANRNSTMPIVFQDYEIGPFFTMNYNNELSNLFVWMIVILAGSILIRFSRSELRKLQDRMKLPKTNARRKFRDYLSLMVHKLARFFNRIDDAILWNFGLMFVLSIYQSGNLWSLLNIRYNSTLLEPPTYFTKGSFALGITCLVVYSMLAIFLTRLLVESTKYLLDTKESLRPLRMKKFNSLFEDFECTKRIQLLFVPLSLLRSFIYTLVLSLGNTSPITQITLTWMVFLAFIIYMIIHKPLKNKWQRRITLWIELTAFGCMTIGFICSFVELAVNIDPYTLDEVGFIFITFSIASTIGGGILTLIQLLALFKIIFQYLLRLIRRNNTAHPITLTNLPQTPHLTGNIEEILVPKE